MSTKYFDILVAKEYAATGEAGHAETRTRWNKVGRAWPTKSPGSFNFELYLMPGQRYFINMREDEVPSPSVDDLPF